MRTAKTLMPRLIWVFIGRTWHLVGFLSWGGSNWFIVFTHKSNRDTHIVYLLYTAKAAHSTVFYSCQSISQRETLWAVSWLVTSPSSTQQSTKQQLANSWRKKESVCWITFFIYLVIIEPRHDKTNKVTVRPEKTQFSLGICPVWSESLLCAWWVVAKDPSRATEILKSKSVLSTDEVIDAIRTWVRQSQIVRKTLHFHQKVYQKLIIFLIQSNSNLL